MKIKKGPIGFLADEAISSLDESSQKSINVKTTEKDLFNEKITNMQKVRVVHNTSQSRASSNESFNDKYIKWFSEIRNKDIEIAGGKGASLGEMYNNKFPVPPGFVITAQAFNYFIERSDLDKKIDEYLKIDIENTEELNNASKEIREAIEKQDIPLQLRNEVIEAYKLLSTEKINTRGINQNALNILKFSHELIFVSIRSSATAEDLADASFAGQQESFLNVRGEKELIEYVKKCFSSLYTPRAIYYRAKKYHSEKKPSIAVIVQKMINSEKSGVVFSKDPINQNEDILIEAAFGLGEGVVSGRINPDYYAVSRELEIKNIKISNKKIAIVRTAGGKNEIIKLTSEKANSRALTNSEILEIANYAIKLEEHYKKPQDIEFALEDGEVYIIQSRPITTLDKKYEKKTLAGNIILTGLGASPGIGVGVVRVINNLEELTKMKKGDILVTEMTNPDMVVSMQKAIAIVTDEGGITSHAAIVSREMGIPAVIGTQQATKILKDGMKITVDGFNGKIYEGEVAETTISEIKPAVETKRIKLKVILDLPDFAERAASAKIDSVGLLRLEGIIASSGKHPLLYEKENNLEEYSKLLENGIFKIARHFKSIWIRTSDIRTDEFSSLKGSPEREINPMLGFHGIRFSLKHPKILKAELKAIKEVAEIFPEKNFGVMFPQIISVEEVKEARKYFEEFKNQLKTPNIIMGVMIETPAAVQIIENICNEVSFVSFGTNDLTQYTLAVDRGETSVQYLYNDLHQSILSQINKVISVCRAKKVETSICGQAGSKKEMVEFLFRKGINSISVNADAGYEISLFIKQLEDNWEKIRAEKLKENIDKQKQQDKNNQINYKNRFNKRKRWFNRFDKWGKRDEWGKKAEIAEVDFTDQNQVKENQVKTSNDRTNKNKTSEIKVESKEVESKTDKSSSTIPQSSQFVPGSQTPTTNIPSSQISEVTNINNKNNLLNKEKIKISAEREGVDIEEYEPNIGPIEPLDNLDRIKKEAEEIQQERKQETEEELEEKHEAEEKIIAKGERVEEK